MEQWIDIASKYGLTGLVLLAVGAFVYKKLWPIIEKRLADADVREQEHMRMWKEQGEVFTSALKLEREDNAKRFEDQGKIFMEALRTQQVMATETHREITQELKGIKQHLRNGK